MRWSATPPPKPKPGDTRSRRVFAWRRTRVNQYIVWLEFYEIYEVFFNPVNGSSGWWEETNRRVLDLYCA